MNRRVRVLILSCGALAIAMLSAACGTEKFSVAHASPDAVRGAVLFSQRCAGCHTLYAAGTHGSAPNIRIAQSISGPNFNVRCERPITRVLYAIENGGFSGAYMPQNIVVGQDAVDVAKFVSQYAGTLAPQQTGVTRCQQQPTGTLPTATTAALAAAGPASSPTTSSASATAARPTKSKPAKSKSAKSRTNPKQSAKAKKSAKAKP